MMDKLDYYRNEFYFNLLGTPKIIKACYLANFFKGNTITFLLILMVYFDNYSLRVVIYTALHGSYGLLWILKDVIFPDKNFQQKMTFFSAIGGAGLLIMYWIGPFIMI